MIKNRALLSCLLIVVLVMSAKEMQDANSFTSVPDNHREASLLKNNNGLTKKSLPGGLLPALTNIMSYVADIRAGLIGTNSDHPVDDPSDNIFHVYLPDIATHDAGYLQYDLFGIKDPSGVARSINEAQATGGLFVEPNGGWLAQRESIPVTLLHKGDNVIRFGLPGDATFYYRVRNVSIQVEKKKEQAEDITINTAKCIRNDSSFYVAGIIEGAGKDKKVSLFCNNNAVAVLNNQFEILSHINDAHFPEHTVPVELKAVFPDGKKVIKKVKLSPEAFTGISYLPSEKGKTSAGLFQRGNKLIVDMNAFNLKASIVIPGTALPKNTTISITALRDIDLPQLPAGMVNVTKGAKGFRFLPHGTRFTTGAQMRIPYDSALIPAGYTVADIRSYYFDEGARQWIDLPFDSLLRQDGIVRSITTHFTDVINGVIKVPESPQTQGYTPTSIKDMKAADPSAGITFIDPPKAGNMGTASLSFPLKIPKGRQGMEPQLTVQYNNEGGNGWMGLGWNLTIPFVGIETRWGVPRYDANFESETYTLNGEQLAPLANRTDFVPRKSDKVQFYPRIEGSFNRIIRHGNSPKNYWWEVTSKNGTRNFYGGSPSAGGVIPSAVLTDDNENIGQWMLAETRDPNDNFIRYDYEQVKDPGVPGGVMGRQVYARRISYTGNGSSAGPYTIEFIRDRDLSESRRADVDISCRLGFKMVSADLLRKVKMSINGQLIRSYDFKYSTGAFYKTLLASITEVDAAGNVFYSHSFEYNDDVNWKSGYIPFGGTEPWHPGDDGIRGDNTFSLVGFTDEGSVLSTTKSGNFGGGLGVTIGPPGSSHTKSISVGGTFGYSEDNSEGLVNMVDVNGDRLPDKLFTKDNSLYYRKNLGGNSQNFGDPILISGGINSFSESSSKNISWGAQAVASADAGIGSVGANIGYTKNKITSRTSVYLEDFNADGLPDIAYHGQVYFNRLDSKGNPQFLLGSDNTPNPLHPGSNVDESFLSPDLNLQAEQEAQFPLQDVIRFWEAPFDGDISIDAPVTLVNVPDIAGKTTKRDGVRVSMQVGSDNPRFSKTIDSNVHSEQSYSDEFTVHQGQRLYFRVQSGYYGDGDLVKWDPIIRYKRFFSTPPPVDADNRPTDYYKASDDYYLHAAGGITFPQDGEIRIDGTLGKSYTSDSVRLIIQKKVNATITTIYDTLLLASSVYKNSLQPSLDTPITTSDTLFFFIKSDSHIDRTAVAWQPHFQYIRFDNDSIPVTNIDGKPLIESNIIPNNSNYNNWIVKTPVLVIKKDDVGKSMSVDPYFKPNSGVTGKIVLTVKSPNKIYGKQFIDLKNGQVQNAVKSIAFTPVKEGEQIFCEYQSDSSYVPEQLIDPYDNLYHGIYVFINRANKQGAGFYTSPKEDYMGTLYRGWGLFSFKGDPDNTPLDESKLNMKEYEGYETDPSKFKDPENEDINDPSKAEFQPLYADPVKRHWKGNDSSVYVDSGYMSSSRLWLHDVSADKLMESGAVSAVDKITVSSSNNYSAGISSDYGGLNGTTSGTDSKITLDMADMNLDGYPDVIKENAIQPTSPTGGLGSKIFRNNVGANTNSANAKGGSADPNMAPAATNMLKTINATRLANIVSKTSITASGNVGTNDDEATGVFYDINGDGLPDKLYSDGKVALNMGYKFADSETWPFTNIEMNETLSYGAGGGLGGGNKKPIGISEVVASIQGGYSLSRSNTANNISFSDINGDGLADKCEEKGDYWTVQLNTGAGFGSPIKWNGLESANTNESVGESINGAFTIGFNLWIIRICINPSLSGGHSISRRQDQIMDIDGDGFPDVLHSEKDGDLTVKRSLIGRTNMLVKVMRPMGSYFTMDYERMGNTYEMPQSKWVLKSVETYDGLPGDGVDVSRNEFSYEGGLYDRRERDFYGFNTVTTKQINTGQGNAVYRTAVQKFSNASYYNKGLLVSEWLEDANGNKFTQTNNTYDLLNQADNNVFFPALTSTEELYYEGKPAPGVQTHTDFTYDGLGNLTSLKDLGDGSGEDILLATIAYQDNNPAYIKSTPKSVVVTDLSGTVLRKRTTEWDDKGNITHIHKFLADGASADYDMMYDPYGNLSEIKRPKNDSGQQMFYRYEYDNTTHTYVTKITDAFHYASTSTYDYRFGELIESISINKQPMRYKLDDKGRISTITGPYEIAAGKPYTIAFEYDPDASVPYAVTRHYDPEYNADIKTITFMDGLGRAVQIKKQVSLFTGKDKDDDLKMVVSGRLTFDAFGRTVETDYPITELIGTANTSFTAKPGLIQSQSAYDVLDRTLSTTLADGALTSYVYDAADNLFTTTVTDAQNNVVQTTTDVKYRKRESKLFGPNGPITTDFYYNAVNELLKVKDTKDNLTEYTYDNLGRKLSINHPDNGFTTYVYDLAGNLTKKTTAQIRKEVPNGGAIVYRYQYERLTDIDYPRYYQNKVTYTYGDSGTGNRAGRLILQQDASGGQEFFYGKLGEITKTIRTMLVSPANALTYVSEQEYDTWNRMKTMTYPDGEVVTYHYNRGGSLKSMDGYKLGNTYKYVNQVGYDEFEQRVYLQYGNGTETNYRYDSLRRRLILLQAQSAGGRQFMNNTYRYDAVSNILGIENNVLTDSGKLGGYVKQAYSYDNLYRLVGAAGVYRGYSDTAGYALTMAYDDLYNITSKSMVDSAWWKSYNLDYTYSGTAPHQPVKIKDKEYRYDANGNLLGNDTTDYFWDEEKRLVAVMNDSSVSQYTYDAGGERAIKSSGAFQGVWLNGAPAGAIRHDDDYTAYISPYLVCRQLTFTKHYYIESERIASKPGNGKFVNTSFPVSGLTAGGVDYGRRMDSIDKARAAWYAAQAGSPGPPTNKNFWLRPENNGIQPPVIVDNSANDAPKDWPQSDSTTSGEPPIVIPRISRDSVHAGYGFDGTGHDYEKNQYFYHSDHLGSTSYVSDALGEISQHEEYSPFGETFFEERKGEYETPYLFNAKERDEETGLYYYGARYYDPKISLWASVDPMMESNSTVFPYSYCNLNPVMYLDPNGHFGISFHEEMTQDAFNNSGLNGGLFNLFNYSIVSGASWIADVGGFAFDHHFDNKKNFQEVQTAWNSLGESLNDRIGRVGSINKILGGYDVMRLGINAHNIEDFYSHSNYVELYIEYFQNENSGRLPSDIPIYSEGIRNEKFKALMERNTYDEYGNYQGLHTGEFHLLPSLFGLLTGKDMGPNSHQRMNKDEIRGLQGKLAEKAAMKDVSSRILEKLE